MANRPDHIGSLLEPGERPHRVAGLFLALAIWLYGTPRSRTTTRS